MRILVSLILLVLFSKLAEAQLPALDHGRVDSIIMRNLDNPPQHDYYVLTMTACMATTTLSPQIIRQINSIEKIRLPHEEIILLVENKGCLPDNLVKPYLIKLFNLKDKDLDHIRFVINNELALEITQQDFIIDGVCMFVHGGYLTYRSDAKWYFIHETELPHNRIVVDSVKRTVLSLHKENMSMVTSISPAANGNILMIRDLNKDVVLLDVETGKARTVIHNSDFESWELYCRFVARGDSLRCTIAKERSKDLKRWKRDEFDIMGAYYDGGNYYFSVVTQNVEPIGKKDFIYQDDGEKVKYKPSDLTINAYNFILKTNKDFAPIGLYLEEDSGGSSLLGLLETYQCFDQGFIVKNDTITLKVLDFPFLPGKQAMLKTLVLRDSAIIGLDDRSKVEFGRIKRARDASYLETYLAFFNGKTVYAPTMTNDLYHYDRKKPISKLEALGVDMIDYESNRMYTRGGDELLRHPIVIRQLASVFDGKYLAVLYYYNSESLFLEIKDENYKTVSTINLSRYAETPRISHDNNLKIHQSCIVGNTLHIYMIEGDEYVLYSYPLKDVSLGLDLN